MRLLGLRRRVLEDFFFGKIGSLIRESCSYIEGLEWESKWPSSLEKPCS